MILFSLGVIAFTVASDSVVTVGFFLFCAFVLALKFLLLLSAYDTSNCSSSCRFAAYDAFPWKSMIIHGYPWTSMDFHGLPWISMDIHGHPWISMDFHGYPWTSMDTWILMDIHGLPWISMDIHGHP